MLRDCHIDDLRLRFHKECFLHLWYLDLTNLWPRYEIQALITSLKNQIIVWLVYLNRRCHRFRLEIVAHQVDLGGIVLSHHKDILNENDSLHLGLVDDSHMSELLLAVFEDMHLVHTCHS